MYFKTFFKKTNLLILLMAIFMPWQVRAQETLTVYNGEATSAYIPMYGNYFDDYTKSECIIPASELTDMEGGTITAITFYAETVGTRTWDNTNQKVFLKEVPSTTLGGSFSGMTDATIVFDGLLTMPTTSTDGYTITFSEEYVYNGGNLLIGVYNDDDGSYNNVKWYGVNNLTSGVSAYGSNGSSLANVSYNAQGFLPKTTFIYAPAGGVGCAKPKNFNAVGITAHEATLTWTAGDAESDWDVYVTTDSEVVPDDNTTPTYQVTECTKALTELTAQTTYYAYVRANCGGGDISKWAKKVFSTTREALAVDQNHPYEQNFETSNDWGFANGTLTNAWCWGSATNNGGSKAMYISNDGGTTNAYSTNSTATVYASKLFNFAQGTYTVVYDWIAYGESNCDYVRVALAPGYVDFTAGTSAPSIPNTWIVLDGGNKLHLKDSWQSQTAEVAVNGTYTMVFIWRNDSYTGTQPPAAIDNISISYMTCPRPTLNAAINVFGRTASLTWTENGTATNWVLQYATNSTFTENLEEVNVTGTASKDLSGLTPETTYYARVKSVLGEESSSWSDAINFTTLATCPKPTLSYVSYSATAYTGSVSWTGSSADAFEVAYRPTSDFDPSDYTLSDVTRVQLDNVTEYTYTLPNLSPETKYYIYIQANCGAEDGLSLWSNRVIFTTTATCLPPSSLTFDGATSTSVTFHWTKGAEDQDAWQIRYKKATESEYTYLLVENHSSNSYTLSGLEPATLYYVNVRAWCGGEDYSKWSLANQLSDKTITTACAELMLPYTCDFEGAMETGGHFASYPVPKCWDRVEMQYGSYSPYSYYPYVYSQSSDAHGGTKSLRMYRTPNSANQTIILPAIDDSYEMSDLQIRFWAKAGSSNNTLYVGIMEGSNFVQVDDVEGVSTTYSEFTVPLSNYTGTGRNIAIKCGSSTGYSYLYFNIDDVLVEVIPTCFIPTDLDVIDTDVNSASITWTAGKDESEWNLQYKKTSESEWSESIHVTELPTDVNPFVLTGLERGIEYEVRVQAYCDDDDQSEWSAMPVSFTTDCGVWTIDNENAIFEGFSGETFPPACWDWIRVSNYYGWQHSTNVYDPVDPTGTAFSYWPSGDTYLILPHMHIDGNAKLNFDMAFSSSGSGEESSVVLSTTGCAAINFSNTLWTATEFLTTKTNVSVNLSAYDGQDVYIAFKFAGVGTSGRMWYVDNVQVYVADNVFVTEGEWTTSSNWTNGLPTESQSVLINAPAIIPAGSVAEVANITIGTGSLTIADGGQLIHNNAVNATLQRNITGYGTNPNVADGWYLIASPVDKLSTSAVATAPYDLYMYNEPNAYWYSNTGSHPFSTFTRGIGYLYANANDMTLCFEGEMIGTNTTNIMVDLDYTGTLDDDVRGFNLVGNPFTRNLVDGDITIQDEGNPNAYYITEGGSNLSAQMITETPIKPGQGFMIQVSGENHKLIINPSAKDVIEDRGYIKIVAGNENGYDNAFIQINNGNTLRKLNIGYSTSVYVMSDGDDYAAARVEELAGTMPVHFKAVAEGEYEITVNTKNIEASTLLLFDNFKNETIDLLETPTYSFKSSADDEDNRFKLIFDFNNNNYNGVEDNFTSEIFVYQSGDELIVNGEGELQIFDVLGRLVTSKNISGVERVGKPEQTGVYIFRLNEHTQKLIIK